MMKNLRSLFLAGLALLGAGVVASCSDGTGPSYEPVVIVTTELEDGIAGEPYAEAIDAEGGDGDYTWEVSAGMLPPGLALEVEDLQGGDDLVISGTPDATGTYAFTLRVRSGDGQTDEQRYSLFIRPGGVPLDIENVGLPPALEGGRYAVALRPVGGPSVDYAWELVSGALPPGLALVGDRIEGTPTSTDTTQLTIRLTSGEDSVTEVFDLQVVADQPGYQITAFDVVHVPSTVRPHLEAAIALWEEALSGDLAPVLTPEQVPAEACGGFGADVAGTATDDLILIVNITEIDGIGEVLGRAGPCLIRNAGLPAVGILTLDAEDLRSLATGSNIVEHILAHEIGHVLGFGSLWEDLELVSGVGGTDPRFTGAQAVAEWNALGRSGNVPLETEGGQGTAEVHWRESVFGDELMTGFSEHPGVFQPFSRVSIASMADLGYEVDYAAADAFSLNQSLRASGTALGNLGRDELYTGPVLVVTRDGRIRTVR